MNYARLLKRDLATTYPLALEARLVVERYAWSAEGGPSLATISAYGSELALWELLECLRCPVEIGDEADELHWWGYVAGVELQIGAVSMAVDLDSMANRVAVAYAYVPEGAGTPGVRATTSWAQDNDSVAEYGTFEELMSAATSETTAATRMRDARLAFAKYPVPAPTVSPGRSDLRATLNCRGWWSTLARRYYSRAGTDLVETTTQIADILTAVGEFLAGSEIVNASGVSLSQYRDGDTSALEEIRALLVHGTVNSRVLWATVGSDRRVKVYEEPAAGSADWLLSSDGVIRSPYGLRVWPGHCPVGVWVKMEDVIPASVDLSRLSSPFPVFLLESEWDERQQTLTHLFRGAENPLDLSKLEPG